MKTTELTFIEENNGNKCITEFMASDNGDTIMCVRLGDNDDYNSVLHIDKDDARMIMQFLKSTFNLL